VFGCRRGDSRLGLKYITHSTIEVKIMADIVVSQELLLIFIGFVLLVVGAVIYFNRASAKPAKPEAPPPEPVKEESLRLDLKLQENKVKVPPPERKILNGDVEKARSMIRTLTLKQEILSLVLRRLYEAEDEGEVSKDERLRLGKPYEDEMQMVSEELKRSEMLVSLAELESIREEMIKKFEENISQTQSRIDVILKELKIEQQIQQAPTEEEKKAPVAPKKKRVIKPVKQAPVAAEEEEEAEEGEAEAAEPKPEGDAAPAPAEKPAEEQKKLSVEERLSLLKKEVMKELDDLDRMEVEDKP